MSVKEELSQIVQQTRQTRAEARKRAEEQDQTSQKEWSEAYGNFFNSKRNATKTLRRLLTTDEDFRFLLQDLLEESRMSAIHLCEVIQVEDSYQRRHSLYLHKKFFWRPFKRNYLFVHANSNSHRHGNLYPDNNWHECSVGTFNAFAAILSVISNPDHFRVLIKKIHQSDYDPGKLFHEQVL